MKALRVPLLTHRFTVSGLNLERFLNAAGKAGIPLVSVKRVAPRSIACECYSADFKDLNSLMEEKGWRVTDARPAKLAATLFALRARPSLWIGLILALITAFTLSRFVWRIEIHGAGAYKADMIAFLLEEGISPGIRRTAIHAEKLEDALTRRYPEIAWFQVYVYNVTLAVEVTHGLSAPALPQAKSGDLVASRDGVVQSIRVYAGTPCVKAGDIVKEGQVLISGFERSANEQRVTVAARGVVTARCWLTLSISLPTIQYKSTESDNIWQSTCLMTPWLRYPQQPNEPSFLTYNEYREELPLIGSFFPIWLRRSTYREVIMAYEPRDAEELRAEAERGVLEKLESALYGNDLIDKWVDYCMIEGDQLVAAATAEWLQDIGLFLQ